jgi:hypothetical protein
MSNLEMSNLEMSNLEIFAYSFAAIAALALIVAGIQGIRAEGLNKTKSYLMIAAGLVTLMNVAIVFMPAPVAG